MPLFKRKKEEKKEEKIEEKAPEVKDLLKELCGDDVQLYSALNRTLLLSPQTVVKEGIASYVSKAQEAEKQTDKMKARMAYQIAGEIALYEGDLSQTQLFFGKAAEVDPEYGGRSAFEFYAQKENAEKALRIAKEYYTKSNLATTQEKTPDVEDNGSLNIG